MKWLWARLKKLSTMKLTRDALLMQLGGAQSKTPTAWRVVSIEIAIDGVSFGFWLNRPKLREVRRREGRCLLRMTTFLPAPEKPHRQSYRIRSGTRRTACALR
jgi:hypothetical protein